MAITATELDLLACFGAEPAPSEADKPWCYVDSTYTTEADGLKVSFKVHPSYKDVELVAAHDDRPLYELKAVGVEDVRVLDFPGCDVFEIRLSKREWLRIRLRPGFGIVHSFERLPPWSGVAET
jgi:hypothetical protein